MYGDSKIRYSRLMAIDEIGNAGIERLQQSTVLVAGCGALGSMAAMQLAASGIGNLRIVDYDTIDISNLQRQFFYRTHETGQSKATVLAQRITDLNPSVKVTTYEELITKSNAGSLINGCDFVVEATDNPASMILIDAVCDELGINCVLAGISGFSGQVLTCIPGQRRYSDIFPIIDNAGVLPCSITGVAGPAAALAASIEVAETIKSLIGIETMLSDKLFVFDLLNMKFSTIQT